VALAIARVAKGDLPILQLKTLDPSSLDLIVFPEVKSYRAQTTRNQR